MKIYFDKVNKVVLFNFIFHPYIFFKMASLRFLIYVHTEIRLVFLFIVLLKQDMNNYRKYKIIAI